MATINPIFGRMKGKYGGSVMYSSNGKQCMRERVVEVANPRTSKQAIQRAIAATVAKFVSAFAHVLNNSLQSESTKVKTLAQIRSLNMTMLRQQAAQNLGTYAEKGSMFVAPNDYLISRGTLAGLNPLTGAAAAAGLDAGALVFPESVLNCEEIDTTASHCFPTIAVGDQITILGAWMEDLAEGSRTAYCRFAFKDDTTPCFIAGEDGTRLLNPAAIDQTKAEGPWDKLVFTYNGESLRSSISVSPILGGNVDDSIDMAGVIVSREAGKLRSTAHMVSQANSEYSLANVYPTYMDGGTSIDMPSEVYLNNDANAQG